MKIIVIHGPLITFAKMEKPAPVRATDPRWILKFA
jgi:hypothetical protein